MPQFRIPGGTRVYAVGDIHGRLDLLDQITEFIRQDLERSSSPHATTIFLGDYIDRGPRSCEVLEALTDRPFPTEMITLRGNHEEMLLGFLREPSTGSLWIGNGGLETLYSYGVDVRELRSGRGFNKAADALGALLPASHLQFLENTRLSFTVGDYFFCHAGVRPKVALESQRPQDLLWIREAFLSHQGRFEKRIVHGHTPVPDPELMPYRINIDTGAYVSGRLTCLILEEATVAFFSTAKRSEKLQRTACPISQLG